MTVFVTGATGYVGGFIVDQLYAAGHKARCLVRSPEKGQRLLAKGAELYIGDVTQPQSLISALAGCDAVIHLVAVIKENPRKNITFEQLNFEGTKNIVNAAKAQGVNRFLHMSSLGADENSPTPYFRTKGAAEHYVRERGLNYTIFRPSFIYGPGDAVYTLLAALLKRLPFGLFPLFGDGHYRHQPVAVLDVARGFVNALENPKAFSKTYNIGGPRAISYREQLQILARTIGKRLRFLPQPLSLSQLLVKAIEIFPFSPINSDQLTMLTTDSVCDPLPFSHDLQIDLTPFEKGLSYLS
jgi:uncharacterized protein YbjT (DUF2867 family)